MQGTENEYDELNDLCDAIVAGEAEGSQEAEDERQEEAQAEALDLCEVEVLDVVEGVAEEGTQVDHKKKKRRRVVVSSDEDTESEFEEE